jgi:membrane-associated phospholipid phosphatase
MDTLNALGIQVIIWLQNLGDWLRPPMEFFSFLGNEQFFLLVAPAIYWCLDTRLGLLTGLFLMVNTNLYSYLKLILHTPRPFWISTAFEHMSFESSFGLPSGHAQNAVVVWGTLSTYFRNKYTWILASLLILLIGGSRLYLGVHFPLDVLAGWVFGALVLWILLRIYQPISAWMKKQSPINSYLIIFSSGLFMILLGALIRAAISGVEVPVEWIQNAASSHPAEPVINPKDISGIISNAGAFCGLAVGALWIQARGGFDPSGKSPLLLGRYLIGVIGVLLFWYGLGELFPRGETFFPYFLRFIRYGLVGLWVTALAPYTFIKLRLANQKQR